MKKIIAIVLSVALILAAVPFAATVFAADDDAVVTVDGTPYDAKVGYIITYTYYLDLSGKGDASHLGKATELEGEFLYDKSQLRLLTEWDDEEEDYSAVLPNVKGGSVTVSNDSPEKLGYSAMKKVGYPFTSKRVLVQVSFEVLTGGEIALDHTLVCLGAGEIRLIEDGVVNTPVQYETVVTVIDPAAVPTLPPVQPTEAPTQAPTQAPTSAPDAPTQAPDIPTQAPTEAPTEAPTQAPTTYSYVASDLTTGISATSITPIQLSASKINVKLYGHILADYDANANFYSIDLSQNGQPYSDTKPVKISVPAVSGAVGVCTVDEEGIVTVIPAEVGKAVITFETTGSGLYALVFDPDCMDTYMLADVDLDGEVTILDATAIQRGLVGLSALSEVQWLVADADRDGEATILDATTIQRYLVGLPNEYNYTK